ncbi:dipicolinate synthase subunit A [Alicyclobacillus contaminans]|uniref:dipicolinate synthase subunit DpsA n=1 Tax=Alicyclobacillus contaminans TaxID=392016 RepID=UPI000408CE5E|nr:dipicolinate synthase subunit DpsA [Alicyclobacillus contaminans]GMA48978.1 dipicolinate synthase subunit A [Alicyclobacillus contaminans]
MLTGRRLVFIGGDARQLEVIAQTTELDASAMLIGFEELNRRFTDTALVPLSPEVFAEADALVLPVAGMDDDGRVDTQFSSDGHVFLAEEHFAAMREGAFVFTGIARSRLETFTEKYKLNLVKLMELDEVAILNSIPTAEGAIALAMEHTDITIHGARTLVLGFGRCGITLARTLGALGAQVRVAARQPADLARIREMGMTPVPLQRLASEVGDVDMVFNTVPALILTASVLSRMSKDCVIIDIASKPGGTDFRYAERRGMTALLAPSLPGLVAPKTAGRIIADSITRILAQT